MSTATTTAEKTLPAKPYQVRTDTARNVQQALKLEQARRLIDESKTVSLMEIAAEWLEEMAANKLG